MFPLSTQADDLLLHFNGLSRTCFGEDQNPRMLQQLGPAERREIALIVSEREQFGGVELRSRELPESSREIDKLRHGEILGGCTALPGGITWVPTLARKNGPRLVTHLEPVFGSLTDDKSRTALTKCQMSVRGRKATMDQRAQTARNRPLDPVVRQPQRRGDERSFCCER